MSSKLRPFRYGWLAALWLAGAGAFAQSQDTTTVRATELRADKLASAAVLRPLAPGAPVRMLSLEGGWALIEAQGQTGWVRASALNLQAGTSGAASQASGSEARGNAAPALGVRSLAARVNRHALIIGVSRYADPAVPPLPGARIDRYSATQMAQAMQVPQSNIRYLQDEQATGDNIRKALAELNAQVQEGDRVFIHYSGHGTRFNDPAAGGCVEALLAYDGGKAGTITNREMTELLKPITARTDKLFVMYDACHSGGLIQASSPLRTRGLVNANDEGTLRPKFADISDECGRPVNVKSRSLLSEVTARGALPQDVIHISAARDNEISFDDELKGGLATQFMRDCLLRDAKDLDNSGALSVDEIRQCAQDKLERRMQNDANFKAHHITLSGNAAFVPAWFGHANVAAATPQAAAPLTGAQALRQMFDQRDAKRDVRVSLQRNPLRVGQDTLDFSVQSPKAGYVYVAQAGSDNQSLYLLFPNEIDRDNRIEAGRTLQLPRPNWRVRASGPAGTNNLLVMVTDGPRDLTQLQAATRVGPFLSSLNDAAGRAALGALMTTSPAATRAECLNPVGRPAGAVCSDAYGAAMVTVEEIQ